MRFRDAFWNSYLGLLLALLVSAYGCLVLAILELIR